MDRQTKIKRLETQKAKVDAQLNHLKRNRFVSLGKRWGKKIFHDVHKNVRSHGFAAWKRHYVVVPRPRLRTLRFERGAQRDALLRANNVHTRLR